MRNVRKSGDGGFDRRETLSRQAGWAVVSLRCANAGEPSVLLCPDLALGPAPDIFDELERGQAVERRF